jgi:muconate cycloisomerase
MRVLHTARAHGLKVMMGCMSESSLAISASVHLSPFADYLDLDSHLNLLPDPFEGLRWEEGRVLPNNSPGLGVQRGNR